MRAFFDLVEKRPKNHLRTHDTRTAATIKAFVTSYGVAMRHRMCR